MIAAVAVSLLRQCALHCDCCTRDIILSEALAPFLLHSTPASQRALICSITLFSAVANIYVLLLCGRLNFGVWTFLRHQLTRLQTIPVASTETFIQADDKWIPSVCTLSGFDVLYVPTCFTTKFSVANNQPRRSLCLFNQLILCPALWHVNSAAFGRYIFSLLFSASPPIRATWAREQRSPSKNGRGTPFPRVPPQFDHGPWVWRRNEKRTTFMGQTG